MKKFISNMPACCTVMLVLLLGAVFSTQSLKAQGAYGGLVGTVTDTSGAIVPGATVTLTNLGTNEKKALQTDASGNYRFVNLLPAQYKMEFEKTSYKRSVHSPVVVLVDSVGRLDIALEVGAVSETVEVTTQAPLLQTESGTLGAQVEGKTVQEMPLNGRNTMNLIALVPGVVPQGSSTGNAAMNQGTHTNNAGWGNFQIGGSLAGQGAFFVDGAPIIGLNGNFVAYIPSQDATQEFKVGTNAVSAEFGRFGGGVVEISTKSGSNAFHGSAYEYFRNRALNANTWNATSKPQWNQNQYGVSVGGPVMRDKIFFQFNWENFSLKTAGVTTTNVPDANMQAAVPVFAGKLTDPIRPACAVYDAVSNTTSLAASCIDPTAKVMKNYFAPANQPGVLAGKNNYKTQSPLGDDTTQYNGRGDINLSASQRIFLKYMYMKTKDLPNDPMHSNAGFKTAGATSKYPTQHAVIGDTITINPTTIFDARLSYMRQYFDDLPSHAGSDLGALGLGSNWAAINKQQTVPELPQLSFSGKYGFYGFNGWVTQQHWLDTYALAPSMIKIMGAHTLKFGGELRYMDRNSLPMFNPGQLVLDNVNYTKDEFANFLLGYVTRINFSTTAKVTGFNWYQGYYLTDTWNVNRKLTITAGIRWELPGGINEKKDRSVVLLPNVDQVINGANAHGILALVNTPLWSDRTNEPSKHNLFSPRLGVAYRITDKTVLRGGYALAYLPPDIALGLMPGNSPVNLAPTQALNSTTAVNYTVSNPFGAGTPNAIAINQPDGRNNPNFMNKYANLSPQLTSVTGVVPTHAFPYMGQWNLGIGQQFKGEQSVEIGYAGAIGIHLQAVGQAGWGLNQLSEANALAVGAGTMTAAAAQATRPHAAYQNMVDSNPLNGTMTYHAMQARYQKRFGGAGMISSGYTWSKSIGDTDTVSNFLDNGRIGSIQNFNNQKAERSLLSYSIAQRWVTSYVLDLPFGKGRKYANNVNGVVNGIIGGWAVNGITLFQSGQPMTIMQTNNNYTNGWGAGVTRPNQTCATAGTGPVISRLGKYFDTTCFSTAGAYALGNAPRVQSHLSGPGQANWDFSVLKKTHITESTSLDFRMEFFNIFNRREFAMPGLNASAATFGVISAQKNNPRQAQASLRFNF